MRFEPELVAKLSTAMIAGAVGVQQTVLPATPITLDEIAVALVGGCAAGILLLSTTDPARDMTRIDKAYTILFSGVIGAMVGPGLTNWATFKFRWVSEGLFENAGGGLIAGAIVPVGFAFVIGLLRAGRDNPEGLIDLLGKLKREILGR